MTFIRDFYGPQVRASAGGLRLLPPHARAHRAGTRIHAAGARDHRRSAPRQCVLRASGHGAGAAAGCVLGHLLRALHVLHARLARAPVPLGRIRRPPALQGVRRAVPDAGGAARGAADRRHAAPGERSWHYHVPGRALRAPGQQSGCSLSATPLRGIAPRVTGSPSGARDRNASPSSARCASGPSSSRWWTSIPTSTANSSPAAACEIVSPDALGSLRPEVVLVMNSIYCEEIRHDLAARALHPELIAL